MNWVIRQLRVDNAPQVLDFIERLLTELGEEADDAGALDRARVLHAWREMSDRFIVLAAVDPASQRVVGIATVEQAFAVYANGCYGVINEMYIEPPARSRGAGAALLEAVKSLGRSRGWSRIDVTAPESPRWARTRAFYERQGFTFAGPKLKCLLRDAASPDQESR